MIANTTTATTNSPEKILPTAAVVNEAPTLLENMPNQQKLLKILDLIKKNELQLPSEIQADEITGFNLIVGSQSAGKTSLLARLTGCDAFVSSQNLGTR